MFLKKSDFKEEQEFDQKLMYIEDSEVLRCFNHFKENLAQYSEVHRNIGNIMTQSCPDHHTDENPGGKGFFKNCKINQSRNGHPAGNEEYSGVDGNPSIMVQNSQESSESHPDKGIQPSFIFHKLKRIASKLTNAFTFTNIGIPKFRI